MKPINKQILKNSLFIIADIALIIHLIKFKCRNNVEMTFEYLAVIILSIWVGIWIKNIYHWFSIKRKVSKLEREFHSII